MGTKFEPVNHLLSQRTYIIETIECTPIHVMLIWAAPIPADMWHCSLWP